LIPKRTLNRSVARALAELIVEHGIRSNDRRAVIAVHAITSTGSCIQLEPCSALRCSVALALAEIIVEYIVGTHGSRTVISGHTVTIAGVCIKLES
jgi:hypothetical protein